MSRPSKGIDKRISLRLSEDDYSKVSFLANKEGVSISEYIRKILKRALK